MILSLSLLHSRRRLSPAQFPSGTRIILVYSCILASPVAAPITFVPPLLSGAVRVWKLLVRFRRPSVLYPSTSETSAGRRKASPLILSHIGPSHHHRNGGVKARYTL